MSIRKILAQEGALAEKYVCERVKMSGPLRHVDDGKNDVLIQLPYPSLVRLLRDYGINRIADFHTDHSWVAK